MASSGPHRRRNSIELPPSISDVIHLKDEFIKLYDRDHPQLQQCIKKLQEIIKTFEEDFRASTEGSRDAGVTGIAGGAAVVTGLGIAGIALAPLTLGASVVGVVGVAAGAAVGGKGAMMLRDAGNKSNRCSSEKKYQMDRLRQDTESKLEEFQDKISPIAEKMKDLHERTEKIMTDFKNVEQDASDLVKMRIEVLPKLTMQMSEMMRLITSIAQIYGGFNLVLDMISVIEYSRALDDMDKLAEKPIHEELDESEIRSKAGKYIAEMRKSINQLQNIIDELEKTTQTIRNLGDNLTNKTF